MTEIIEKKSMDVWKSAISYIIQTGTEHTDERGRIFRQLLNVNLVIEDPSVDITEPINILSRSDKWLYPTIDEIRRIFLMKKTIHTYKYTYGQRIFNYNYTINQIDDYVIPLLKDKKRKFTRRLYVSLWDPIKDSKTDEKEEMPGVVGIWFKLVDKRLIATAMIRNNDCFMGFPANLYQIYVLQKYITDKTGTEPGRIVFYSLSMHIYLDHLEDIKNLLGI